MGNLSSLWTNELGLHLIIAQRPSDELGLEPDSAFYLYAMLIRRRGKVKSSWGRM